MSDPNGPKAEDLADLSRLLVSLDVSYVLVFTMGCFFLSIPMIQIFLTETRLRFLSRYIPQSSQFILIGIVLSFILKFSFGDGDDHFPQWFTSRSFFDYLLPPIILEATFRLYSRDLMLEIDGILFYALLGTIFNIFAIGLCLWAVGIWGISLIPSLLFASVISAVDPVAVMAVFEELGVQRSLNVLLFGESLFNDGVSVVAYETLNEMASMEHVKKSEVIYAVLSFFTVGLGGFVMGVLYGMMASFICKCCTMKSQGFEVSIVLVFAYLSYLNTALFKWSGILSIMGCGFAQKRYAFKNMHEKSKITIEGLVSALAYTTESVIFLLFGLQLLEFKTYSLTFTLWSLLFMTVFRFVTVFGLGQFLNRHRTLHKMSWKHLLVLSYGGLRGAVAFAMSNNIKMNETENVDIFRSTTLALILITCLFQGSTIKLLVHHLKFEKDEDKKKIDMLGSVVNEVSYHTMQGLTSVIGGGGNHVIYFVELMDKLDKKYVQPFLCKSKANQFQLDLLKGDLAYLDLTKDPRMWTVLDYANQRLKSSLF